MKSRFVLKTGNRPGEKIPSFRRWPLMERDVKNTITMGRDVNKLLTI